MAGKDSICAGAEQRGSTIPIPVVGVCNSLPHSKLPGSKTGTSRGQGDKGNGDNK